MKRLFLFGLTALACILVFSCKNNPELPYELTDIISDLSVTSAPEADYTRPAIITGHISNRQVYPDTREVRLTIPTLGSVPITIDSPIWGDNSFSFQFTPYALRQVSINPYMPEIIIGPGDSLHFEIDFADLLNISCTGKGADNNAKLIIFHNRYYLRNWSGLSSIRYAQEEDLAGRLMQEYNKRRSDYLDKLDSFIKNENPSDELAEFCRKEIETDYYSFVNYLYEMEQNGGDVSNLINLKEFEKLFENPCLNGNLYGVVNGLNDWLNYIYYKDHQDLSKEERFVGYMDYLKKNTRKGMLRQALITDNFNRFIDRNDTERFEQLYSFFTQNVDNPILKLSTRDRYLSRKSFKDDPRALTNAVLYPDRRSDVPRTSAPVNDGVRFLRDRVEQNQDKVIYINIGAHWCRGCVEERPYMWKMARTLKDEPLRIVNIIIGAQLYPDRDSVSTFGSMVEDYLLTEEQFYGIDHILKLGNNGIPYYILINKEGLIVDYGNHLRPSSQSTLDKIRALLAE